MKEFIEMERAEVSDQKALLAFITPFALAALMTHGFTPEEVDKLYGNLDAWLNMQVVTDISISVRTHAAQALRMEQDFGHTLKGFLISRWYSMSVGGAPVFIPSIPLAIASKIYDVFKRNKPIGSSPL